MRKDYFNNRLNFFQDLNDLQRLLPHDLSELSDYHSYLVSNYSANPVSVCDTLSQFDSFLEILKSFSCDTKKIKTILSPYLQALYHKENIHMYYDTNLDYKNMSVYVDNLLMKVYYLVFRLVISSITSWRIRCVVETTPVEEMTKTYQLIHIESTARSILFLLDRYKKDNKKKFRDSDFKDTLCTFFNLVPFVIDWFKEAEVDKSYLSMVKLTLR